MCGHLGSMHVLNNHYRTSVIDYHAYFHFSTKFMVFVV